MKHLYYRADNSEIKLTFKFDTKAVWKDTSPDPLHISFDIDKAVNALSYSERQMNVGPLKNIIIKSSGKGLRIWCEISQSVPYEIYDESDGRLVSVIFRGPFAGGAPKQEMFSFDFRDADIRDVLMALAKSAGVNIIIGDKVTGTISLAFEGLTFDQALGYILKPRGLGKVVMGKNIIVDERESLENSFDLWKTRRFTLKYIEPDAAKSALSMYLPPDRIVADSVNRSLLIKGRDDELQKVEEVLTTIDVALETRVFPLNNNIYEAEEQLARFKELLKIIIFDEARVQYDFLQKTMIVKGTKEELEGVAELIGNLDRKLPQIMIDVKMVEINRNKIKDLGVKWTVGGEQGQISFGEMSLGGSMERSDLVSIQIKALEQKGLGRLVGNPRILTLSGKTATINVGDRVPYRQPVITPDGKVTYELQFMDVGIKLEVTPSITSDGMVIVHAKPNISTFTEREYVLEGLNFKDPQKSEKTADTTARLRNGETLVIGGLIRSEDVENITKIPLLSEIPIIGGLFTLRNKTHKETELIVFLTPYLVEY